MTPLVRTERRSRIDVLTLDSPHNRNALSIQLLTELRRGIADSAAGDARALALDHTGTVFCAGVDLRERQSLPPGTPSHSELLGGVLRDLWAYEQPVVCRVGGAARGGAMGLVAASDVVIASPAATFAFSEVRVGVAPALVAALALQKVPLGHLLPALVTGETFSAAEAQRLGLVAQVDDDPDAVARVCDGIVRGAPHAVATTKALARRAAGVGDLDALLDQMEALSAQLFAAPEAVEGMAAFTERRAPSWTDAR